MTRALRVFLKILCLTVLLAAPAARAQWAVYDLRVNVEEVVSENFIPYTGMYVIAPINGGPASLIFITEEGGRFYNVAENGARYFVASGPVGRLAVISAVVKGATASAMYQAVGLLNSTISYNNASGQHEGNRVPTDLLGTMLASDPESVTALPAADGSLGMVGTAKLAGTLRVDLSRILNQQTISMSLAVKKVTDLLEKYGYQLDDGSVEEAFDPPQIPQMVKPDPSATAPDVTQGPQLPAPSPPPAPAPKPAEDGVFAPGQLEEFQRQLQK